MLTYLIISILIAGIIYQLFFGQKDKNEFNHTNTDFQQQKPVKIPLHFIIIAIGMMILFLTTGQNINLNSITSSFKGSENILTDQALNEQKSQNSNDAYSYRKLAQSYQDKRDFAKAEEYINIAIKLNPQDYKAYIDQGNGAYMQNDNKRALELYKKAAKLNPDPSAANPNSSIIEYSLGSAYQVMEDYENSIIHYEKAVKLNFPGSEITNALSYSYLKCGEKFLKSKDQSKAKKLFDKALSISTEKEKTYDSIAQAYRDAGQD